MINLLGYTLVTFKHKDSWLAGFFIFLNVLDKYIKKEGRIGWSARSLRVELSGEEGFFSMLHSLVGIIIQVDKQRLPALGQGPVINGKTVVL